MKWTPSQQEAIEARNDSILVSAAAGSGKTAVLVERVLALLREGGQIERMLIVTFTHAAAGEMRERIGLRLAQEGMNDPHLSRQALKINRAPITTLHSFCKQLIRENFAAISVDPGCRIANQDIADGMLTAATDAVMNDACAAPTADETALLDAFEDDAIVEMLGQLRAFLMAQAEPWAWTEAQGKEETASIEYWKPALSMLMRERAEYAAEYLPQMQAALDAPNGPERYRDTYDQDRALNAALLSRLADGNWPERNLSFARLSTKRAPEDEDPKAAEQFKNAREQWKKAVKDAVELIPADTEQAENDMRAALPFFRALCGLAKRIDEKYFELKQSKNLLDYNDLEHLALRLMRNEAVRKKIASEYDTIFVDEYQDVSGTQEAILRAMHVPGQNSLFMVGDVKQSIYRFRLADPTLFLRKYADYSADKTQPQHKILLQQNFRSEQNILLSVNQVFRHAMREAVTEIEYDDAAALYPGPDAPFGSPAEIHLLTGQAAEAEDADETAGGELTQGYRYEAAFIAQRIHELVSGETVRGGDGQERPVRFRDIAILVRNASGRAPYLAQVLQSEGIPVYSDADAQYFELPEVVDLVNILRVIDNPLQDMPLIAAMHCPCFGFSEEELAQIRILDRHTGTPFHRALTQWLEKEGALADKVRAFWKQAERWRFLSEHERLDKLIWRVLLESGLYMRAGAEPHGDLAQANLRLMVERAQGDTAQDGLSAFLSRMTRLHGSDDAKTAKTLGENEDVVRIMTIHKSKGLEFPVVFLAETARKFTGSNRDGALSLHAKYGVALPFIDQDGALTRETCAQKAIRGIALREQRAEECRLLYVGMTRAKSRLIIIGSPKNLAKSAEKWAAPRTAAQAGNAVCMLDWVMEAIGGVKDEQRVCENGAVIRIHVHPVSEMDTEKQRAYIAPPELAHEPPRPETVALMSRTLPALPPLKSSVSAISHPIRQEKDEWESPDDKRRPPRAEAPAVPSFLLPQDEAAVSPQLRGTVTHKALGLVDYDLVRKGDLAGALDEMQARGVLSDEERGMLSLRWLRAFFDSELGRIALASREVHREWSFDFMPQPGTILQGVLDLCCLTDEGWVLVDYKTDRADADELLARYRVQLTWYARALEVITGKKVCRACLFGLREGVCVPVPLDYSILTIPAGAANG